MTLTKKELGLLKRLVDLEIQLDDHNRMDLNFTNEELERLYTKILITANKRK